MHLQYTTKPVQIADGQVSMPQCDIDGDLRVTDSCMYVNLTNNALVDTGVGYLIGVIINNHINGTMRLWDNTTPTVTPLTGVITFSAVATTGERFIPFWGARFNTALYCQLSGSDITLMFN